MRRLTHNNIYTTVVIYKTHVWNDDIEFIEELTVLMYLIIRYRYSYDMTFLFSFNTNIIVFRTQIYQWSKRDTS